MESSSKGFMLCFTPCVSIAVREELTRGLTCEMGGVRLGGQMGERRVGEGSIGRWRAYGIVYDPFDGY